MTLLLSRRDVADLLTLDDAIAAVERAFRLLGEGRVAAPAIAAVHAADGAFHIKAALLGDRFAAKINGNFFHAVPRIQGVIVLCSDTAGTPLAILDSIEITILRTAAATAVAAKYLARSDARTLLVAGCGVQGVAQARAVSRVRPIDRIFAFDTNRAAAEAFPGEPVDHIVDADIVVTCTPSRTAFLDHVRPGTFVAAVGADSPEKQEIAPSLLAASRVVTDVTEQSASIGDLHHAIAAGVMTRDDVYGDLGEIVASRKRGRTSDDDVIVFDSTGMALQDVAAAAIVYERALAAGRGVEIDLGT